MDVPSLTFYYPAYWLRDGSARLVELLWAWIGFFGGRAGIGENQEDHGAFQHRTFPSAASLLSSVKDEVLRFVNSPGPQNSNAMPGAHAIFEQPRPKARQNCRLRAHPRISPQYSERMIAPTGRKRWLACPSLGPTCLESKGKARCRLYFWTGWRRRPWRVCRVSSQVVSLLDVCSTVYN